MRLVPVGTRLSRIFISVLALLVLTSSPFFSASLTDAAASDISLSLLGQVGGATTSAVVDGNYVYVSNGNRVQIFDLADKTKLTLLSTLTLPGALHGFTAAGNRLYVAAGFSGVVIVDVSNKSAPKLLGYYDNASPVGAAREVAVDGNLMFVADYGGGMCVADATDPAKPTELACLGSIGNIFDIEVVGGYVYATGDKGLHIVDVTSPRSPKLRSTLATPAATGAPGLVLAGLGVAIKGTTVYIADGKTGIVVVDASDVDNPKIVGQAKLPVEPMSSPLSNDPRSETGQPPSGYDIFVKDNFAYMACYTGGLRVFDISDPAKPVHVAGLATPLWGYEVDVQGTLAYVADYDGGLRIIDVSAVGKGPAPYTLREVGSSPVTGSYRAVAVSGRYAYGAAGAVGLAVMDVTKADNPVVVAFVDTPGFAYGVTVAGNRAYVSDDYAGMQIVDISNPPQPKLIGSLDTPGSLRNIAVRGSLAYCGDGPGGLRIVDVSNPAAPVEVGSLVWPAMEVGTTKIPVNARLVSLHGNYALVGDEYAGLRIVDVSNPRAPKLVGTWYEPDTKNPKNAGVFIWGAEGKGNYAFAASAYGGMYVIDITDPAKPVNVAQVPSSLKPTATAWVVALKDSYAYLLDAFDGISVIDISEPTKPKVVTTYDSAGTAWAIVFDEDKAYLGDGACGMSILGIVPSVQADIAAKREGNTISYSITLKNLSSMPINQLFISGLVPAGATFVRSDAAPAGTFFQGVQDSGPTGKVAVWLGSGLAGKATLGPLTYKVSVTGDAVPPVHAWVAWGTTAKSSTTSGSVVP